MVGRSYCFVPGCKTGYSSDRKACKNQKKRTYSLFKPPRDHELLKIWKTAIARADKELTENESVCELHFAADDIERFYRTVLPDGSVCEIKRGRPILKKDAIPIKISNLRTHVSKRSVKSKLPLSHDRSVRENKLITFDCPNVADMSIKSETASVLSDPDSSFPLEENSYNEILENISSMRLPSNLWSMTCTSNYLICAKWNEEYIAEKRVVIEKDLTVKVFIKSREIEEHDIKNVSCVEDISLLLLKVNSYVACSGVDDKSMTTCLAYCEDALGTDTVWCKQCEILRKQRYDIAQLELKKMHNERTYLREHRDLLPRLDVFVKTEG